MLLCFIPRLRVEFLLKTDSGYLFVCVSAYANVYFKTILQECLRAGLPPGFPSTAPSPDRVSAVLGTLAVRLPNPKKKSASNGAHGGRQRV